MSEERLRILEMFKAGKLNMEETMDLLEALGTSKEDGEADPEAEGTNQYGESQEDASQEDASQKDASQDDAPHSSHHAGSGEKGENIFIRSHARYDGEIKTGQLSISGMGSFTGPVSADQISISGMADFQKDVQADRISVAGKFKGHGKVKGDRISISGMGEFQSDVEADQLSVSGQSRIEGNLHCDSLAVSGGIKIKEEISADSISVSGSCRTKRGIHTDRIRLAGFLQTGGDVETDQFLSKGGFAIQGRLVSDGIHIELNNNSQVKGDMVADHVVVEKGKTVTEAELEVNSIQADVIQVVHTRADLLMGTNIRIGEGCEIGKVEYDGDLIVENGAIVHQQIRKD